jgi:hypothetical protein
MLQFRNKFACLLSASLSLLKWTRQEENLALQDVFSKVFEVGSIWTAIMKQFTEDVSMKCTVLWVEYIYIVYACYNYIGPYDSRSETQG